MSDERNKPWRRRLKSGVGWPKRLRNSRLLRLTIFVGVSIYRLWRLLYSLYGLFDG